jgi:hypothetical protein
MDLMGFNGGFGWDFIRIKENVTVGLVLLRWNHPSQGYHSFPTKPFLANVGFLNHLSKFEYLNKWTLGMTQFQRCIFLGWFIQSRAVISLWGGEEIALFCREWCSPLGFYTPQVSPSNYIPTWFMIEKRVGI